MTAATCLMLHFRPGSPIHAYRAAMAEDVRALIASGTSLEAAWTEVAEGKLADLSAERQRIADELQEAYAKTPAGQRAATPKPQKATLYRTREAAEQARDALGNTHRLQAVKGGFILRQSTDKELAAAERNGRRLASGGGVDVENDSLLTAIAKLGGIAMKERADTIGTGNRNIGGKMLFRLGGKDIDTLATEALQEFGYIPADVRGDPTNWLRSAIAAEFAGTQTYHSEQGTEWMEDAQRRYEDGMGDPEALADFTPDDLESGGYTGVSPAVQAATESMLADAAEQGIDIEALQERAATATQEGTVDEYHAEVARAVAEAVETLQAQRRVAGGPDAARARAGDQGDGESAGEAGQEQGDEGLTLEAQDAESLRAKTDREAAALDAERTGKAAEQSRLAREAQDREVNDRARQDASAENFQLGQDANDALAGQGGLFEAAPPASDQQVSGPAEEKGAAGPVKAARLTDAGEELIRNRRGKLKGLAWDDVSAMNDTLKVAQVVKSNVWPRPDYAKMVEDGAPAWKAAALKAVYDKLAAAPVTRTAPTDADLKAYIETMHQVRDTLLAELDRVQEAGGGGDLWKSLKAGNVFGKVFPIPADARPMYGAPSPFDRVSEQGKANNKRALLIGGNGAVQALQFSHRMLSKVKDLLADGFPAKQEAWQKSYAVAPLFAKDGRWVVVEKGSTSRSYQRIAKGSDLAGYESPELAEAVARSLVTIKKPADTPPPSRGLDLADANRTGPDWRGGKDVTAEQVMSHFGFRGVNLGEYVKAKQGVAQLHLNHVFDAFSDLADLLGVPPKAMSLNGTLGVAVGAQGSGKALAHFVPGVNEINITRDSGAGALAHEFGHAMDHYFATQHGRAVSMAKRPYLSAVVETIGDAGSVRPEVMEAMRAVMKAINARPMSEAEARKYLTEQRELNQRHLDRWVKEFKGNKGADAAALDAVAEKLKRGDVGEPQDTDVETNLSEFMRAAGLKPGNAIAGNAFAVAYRLRDLADEARFMASHIPQVDTDYAKASAAMDAKKAAGEGYWSTPWEKFARAFETFTMDALKDRERESLYLSGLVDSAGWRAWAAETGKAIPYPAGDERMALQQAFQKMADTIQTREDDAGNVAMFSRAVREQGLPREAAEIHSARDTTALKAHPDYKAAKAGDAEAAARLVRDLVSDADIAAAAEKIGPGAVWVFPHAEEATGHNKIPAMMAARYAAETGGSVGPLIVQTNRAFHTGADAMQRLIARPLFDGQVTEGARYVIADDVSTMGGTLAELADHIRAGGGKVVGVVTLANAGRAPTMAGLRLQTGLIEKRYGQTLRDTFHIDPAALTRDEARYVLGFRDADALRTRAAAAERQRGDRLRAKGLSAQEVGDPSGEGDGGFSRTSRAPRGVPMADAKAVVAAIREAMPTAPAIYLHETVTQAPKALRDAIKSAGAENDVEAAYHEGEIHVFPRQLASVERMMFVVGHHEIRHHGLRSMLGPRLGPVLLSMWSSNPALKEAAQAKIDAGFAGSRTMAVEEALADMPVEQMEALNGWDKIVAAVRQWLRQVAARLRRSEFSALADMLEPEAWTDRDVAAMVNRAESVSKGGAALFRTGGTVFSDGAEGAQFSRTVTPDWITAGSPALQAAAGKIATYAPAQPLAEKARAMAAGWQQKLVQGAFDAYAPLKNLSTDAYIAARMTKGADGAFEGMLMYGKPVMTADGGIQGDLDGGGFMGVMRELKGEHDRFFMWLAGNRAKRLAGEGKENLFTPEDIAAMVKLNEGVMADGTSRALAFKKAHDGFNDYSKSVLDVAEQSGLIEAESRKLWEHDFYVPFYRVNDDMEIAGPSKIKGLVRRRAFEKLKGGKENLGDLMDNTLRNWSHLLSASLANVAASKSLLAAESAGIAIEAKEADAKEIAKATGKKGGAVYFMDSGLQRWFVVEDPAVLTAISSLEAPALSGLPLKIMGKFKKYLTMGVTVAPAFKVRNLIRDTLAAPAANEMSFNVAKNLAQGWKATDTKTANYAQMLFSGGLMKFGTYLEGDRAENVKRLIAQGVEPSTILDSPNKVRAALGKMWDTWQDFGDRLENINRTALYQQLIEKGMSPRDAAFQARDMMDFSLQGAWAGMRTLNAVVPFLNARMQGLYKLGRAAKQDPKRMGYMVAAVSLASIALMLAYGDDDDWKAREDWDRDGFWWIKIGDTAFRIPKPFELGAMGTIAERSVELMVSDEMTGARFGERMKQMVMDTFAMNPVPQLFKPMLDLYANKDSFTGRQIETLGMERLSKGERYGPNTTALAKALGAAGGYTGVSPVQVDHMIRAYFGWLGVQAATAVDVIASPLDATVKPASKLDDWAGGFVKELPAAQSRYLEDFYKQAKAVSEVMADLKRARETGDLEKAAGILEADGDKIKAHRLYQHAERQIGEINKRIRILRYSPLGTAEEKREQLDGLVESRNRLAKIVSTRQPTLQ